MYIDSRVTVYIESGVAVYKKFSCMWLTLGRKISFFLIFDPFYGFDQKKLFKQIQIFLRICPFSNMLRKANFLSISVLLSEIALF